MTEELNVGDASFLGAQDGVPERDLMKALTPVLTKHPDVERAYLARVMYTGLETESVALCLVAAVNDAVVEEVSQVFASMFNPESALDMIFVNRAQEQSLAKVCTPFYTAQFRN